MRLLEIYTYMSGININIYLFHVIDNIYSEVTLNDSIPIEVKSIQFYRIYGDKIFLFDPQPEVNEQVTNAALSNKIESPTDNIILNATPHTVINKWNRKMLEERRMTKINKILNR